MKMHSDIRKYLTDRAQANVDARPRFRHYEVTKVDTELGYVCVSNIIYFFQNLNGAECEELLAIAS